jgi:hypothetical protein
MNSVEYPPPQNPQQPPKTETIMEQMLSGVRIRPNSLPRESDCVHFPHAKRFPCNPFRLSCQGMDWLLQCFFGIKRCYIGEHKKRTHARLRHGCESPYRKARSPLRARGNYLYLESPAHTSSPTWRAPLPVKNFLSPSH